MGIIHSRASKKRDRAEAALLRQEANRRQDQASENRPWWEQRTLAKAITALLRRY